MTFLPLVPEKEPSQKPTEPPYGKIAYEEYCEHCQYLGLPRKPAWDELGEHERSAWLMGAFRAIDTYFANRNAYLRKRK